MPMQICTGKYTCENQNYWENFLKISLFIIKLEYSRNTYSKKNQMTEIIH